MFSTAKLIEKLEQLFASWRFQRPHPLHLHMILPSIGQTILYLLLNGIGPVRYIHFRSNCFVQIIDFNDESASFRISESVVVVLLAISFLLYIPMILYFALPLFKARSMVILKKRHSELTLYAIYAFIIFLVMANIFTLCIFNIGYDYTSSYLSIYSACTIIFQFVTSLIYSLLFLRLWLTLFDIRYNQEIGNEHWKHVIDDKYSAKKSWFVRYRGSLGNKSRLLRLFILICVLTTIATAVLLSTLYLRFSDFQAIHWFTWLISLVTEHQSISRTTAVIARQLDTALIPLCVA